MLIQFAVKNWKSYRDRAELRLAGSLERRRRDTLSAVPGFRSLKVLPLMAIYGGNASGKTSLIQAMAFLRDQVVFGPAVGASLPVQPFRLDGASAVAPAEFEATFSAGGSVYQFSASIGRAGVVSESLWRLLDRRDDVMVYERRGGEISLGEGEFSEPERAEFVARGTRGNQLFLNAAVQQSVGDLRAPYAWFRDVLTPIGVSSQNDSLGMFYTRPNFLEFAASVLRGLDTGIEDISGEEVDLDALPVPPQAIAEMAGEGREKRSMVLYEPLSGDYGGDLYFIDRDGQGLRARRLVTRHRNSEGRLVPFPLSSESSGSRRLVELMPMLFELLGGFDGAERVYVVDELDRCLHSMLTERLLSGFLETCGRASRRQLLFTTQDLLLMDQAVLRRDEMLIAERDGEGASEVFRLDEYEGLRPDLDLMRSYLEGRFGGVPMFSRRLGRE